MTNGLRTHTSPSTPSGSHSPNGSRISRLTVMIGRPRVPGNASMSCELATAMAVLHSVSP